MIKSKSIFQPIETHKLSSCAYVFDHQGKLLFQNKSGISNKMPMASTVKIAIALALIKRINEGKFSLNDIYTLTDEDIVPGFPDNFLDRFFFNPEPIKLEVTLGQMLVRMISTSDNTSTDFILRLLGGPEVVNQLVVNDLALKEFCFTSFIRQLLSDYYGFQCVKTPENIQQAKSVLPKAFDQWPNEEIFFKNELNSCSAQAMVELLSKIAFPAKDGNPSWLTQAAPKVLETMKLCETNTDGIMKGIENSNAADRLQFCAGKTGSLGTISNDVAIIQFGSEKPLILAIAVYSCLSNLPQEKRDDVIAEITTKIIDEYISIQNTNVYQL